MKALNYSILLFLLFVSCKTTGIDSSFTTVNHTNKNINYEGRIGKNADNSPSEIYWSGSSIKINFNG